MPYNIGFDRTFLGDKIVEETDESIVFEAVIGREIVHQYDDGMAYKPADELEKAVEAFNLIQKRPLVTGHHPETDLVVDGKMVKGVVENVRFVKNLVDPKTGRPMDRGIKADLRFYKKLVPPDLIESMREGKNSEVSMGFTFDMDPVPGEWNGQKYDYVQRNLFIDHVLGGIENGRCPKPFCGIGVDQRRVALDPWETTEEYHRSGHQDPGKFDSNSLRTIDISEGIKAVTGCPTGQYEGGNCKVGTQVQSYLFDKSKFSLSEAKAWFESHKGGDIKVGDCPICDKIRELGVKKFAEKMVQKLGKDVAFKVLDQTEKEIWMEECKKNSTEAECEEQWAAKHVGDQKYKDLIAEAKKAIDDLDQYL